MHSRVLQQTEGNSAMFTVNRHTPSRRGVHTEASLPRKSFESGAHFWQLE